MPGNTIDFGTIGFGGFTRFAAEQSLKVPGARPHTGNEPRHRYKTRRVI
jgi:hypothetical protein